MAMCTSPTRGKPVTSIQKSWCISVFKNPGAGA